MDLHALGDFWLQPEVMVSDRQGPHEVWLPISGQTWARHKGASTIVMKGSQLWQDNAGRKVEGSNPELGNI